MPAYINPFQGRRYNQAVAPPPEDDYDTMLNTPSRGAYQESLGEMPTYEKPSFGSRLSAALAGAFTSLGGGNGVGYTQQLLTDPYRIKYRDWANKTRNLKELADLDEEGLKNKLKFKQDQKSIALREEESKLNREKFGHDVEKDYQEDVFKGQKLDQDSEDLQLRRDREAREAKEFGVTSGLRKSELDLDKQKYSEGAPKRTAELANIEADTAYKGRGRDQNNKPIDPAKIDKAHTLALEELMSNPKVAQVLKPFIQNAKTGTMKGRPQSLKGQTGMFFKDDLPPQVKAAFDKKVQEILSRRSTSEWEEVK